MGSGRSLDGAAWNTLLQRVSNALVTVVLASVKALEL
jgi:hypothetical protein